MKKKLIVGAAIGRPLGWAHFSPLGDGYDIIHIYVLPNSRKTGVARKLIQNFINKVNPREITLEVRKSNNAAINLYHSLGFEIISERKAYYSNNEDAFVMKYE